MSRFGPGLNDTNMDLSYNLSAVLGSGVGLAIANGQVLVQERHFGPFNTCVFDDKPTRTVYPACGPLSSDVNGFRPDVQ